MSPATAFSALRAPATAPLLRGAVFFLLLLITALLYWPGLHGTFLLDDPPNLRGLVEFKALPTLDNLIYFIGSGPASQLSRPVAMATFAAQYYAWPSLPFDFKYVNLNLHLLNGCLIFWLFLRLGRLLSLREPRAQTLALLTAGIWLIHPLNISTTLYVVQRMTQMATLFTLLGILLYLVGRDRLQSTAPHALRRGLLWMSAGVVAGGILATLSKENGVLLPLFILVIESTLLASSPRPALWRPWAAVFLLAPLLLLLAYFITHGHQFFVLNYQTREFTLVERLLSECRILLDYLRQLLLPAMGRLGLFQDDYPLSRGLLDPVTTLPAVLVILALPLAALKTRRSHPLFAFGVLWFLGGHLMESTALALEPYFEHRNHLPAIGLWFAIAGGAMALLDTQTGKNLLRQGIVAGGVLLCLLYGFITHTESTLWGDPIRQAEVWARERPDSRRAQGQLAEFMALAGEYPRGAEIYRQLAERLPSDTGALIYWLRLRCNHPETPLPERAFLLERMRNGFLNMPALGDLASAFERNDCPLVPIDLVLEMLRLVPQNPSYIPEAHQKLVQFNTAILEERAGNMPVAMALLEEAMRQDPSVLLALKKVAWLSQEGRFEDALAFLDQARRFNQGNPLTWLINQRRIAGWDEILRFLIDLNRHAP